MILKGKPSVFQLKITAARIKIYQALLGGNISRVSIQKWYWDETVVKCAQIKIRNAGYNIKQGKLTLCQWVFLRKPPTSISVLISLASLSKVGILLLRSVNVNEEMCEHTSVCKMIILSALEWRLVVCSTSVWMTESGQCVLSTSRSHPLSVNMDYFLCSFLSTSTPVNMQ